MCGELPQRVGECLKKEKQRKLSKYYNAERSVLVASLRAVQTNKSLSTPWFRLVLDCWSKFHGDKHGRVARESHPPPPPRRPAFLLQYSQLAGYCKI